MITGIVGLKPDRFFAFIFGEREWILVQRLIEEVEWLWGGRFLVQRFIEEVV